jgi:AcrR family transcriptional regulator
MSGHSGGKRTHANGGRPAEGSEAESAILNATEQLLADVPLHELSVAQIIDRAHVSRGTFYFYFSSKFAVVTALVRQVVAEIYAASRPTLHIQGGTETRAMALDTRIRDSARVWEDHRAVLRATVENWHVFPELEELWLEMIGGLSNAIAREIEQERAAGRAPDGPEAHGLGAALAWATERCLYVIGLGLPAPAGDPEAMLDALVQIWITTYYGAPSAAHAAAA